MGTATDFYENAFFFMKCSNSRPVYHRTNLTSSANGRKLVSINEEKNTIHEEKEYKDENFNDMKPFSIHEDVRKAHHEVLDDIIEEDSEVYSDVSDEEADDTESVQHPLATPWTFWCDRTARGASAKEYIDSLKKIKTVETIEEFWQIYHYLPPLETLASDVNYHIMRGGRQPMWEDEANCRGGTWRIRVHKAESMNLWMEMLLSALGEQLEDAVHCEDSIVGVSVSIRDRDDIIQIWNNDSAGSTEATEEVFRRVRDMFPRGRTYINAYYKPNHAHIGYESSKRP